MTNQKASMRKQVVRMAVGMLLALLCLTPQVKISAALGKLDAAAVAEVIAGNNEFAWELFQKVAVASENRDRNIFFSPYSVSTALAMTYAGSRDETAAQMAQVLRFTLPQPELHQAFAVLDRQMNPADPELYRLSCANALWGQYNYHFESDFTELINQYYHGGMQMVDFVAQPEATLNTINQWVERQTASKIRDLLQPGDISSLTRLVLTNAIYFKGDWESPFQAELTKSGPFTTAAGQTVTASLMRQKGKFRYAADADMQILELPYAGKDLAMLVFLPRGNFDQFEASLTTERIQGWREQLTALQVAVTIPKFKFATRYYLNQLLSEMGMPAAFSASGADFSGITGARDLHIDHVIHQAVIDVDEKGSEAAAATAVVMNETSIMDPDLVFQADHPFCFAMVHQPTGSILFLGRVAAPTQ
jgi:serpin B